MPITTRLKSWFNRFLQPVREKVLRLGTVFDGLLMRIETSRYTDYESYLRAATNEIWVLWKCTDIIAKAVKDTPFSVVRSGGSGDEVEVKGLSDLLSNPNPEQTIGEFIYLASFYLNVTGNAYIAKIEPNANGDRPKQLWVLNPKLVKLVIDPRLGFTGLTYTVNGEIVPFSRQEIIHIKIPHPNKEFYGLGVVESAEEIYNESKNRQTWTNKFWQNGASPSGILINETDKPYASQTDFEKAQAAWQAKYGGSKNAGKTAWLTGKWNYQQIGLTAVEMQNLENSRWNAEQIAHVNGVPLSVLGLRDAANYATASIDELIFRRYTVKPLVMLLQDGLQKGLVAGFGNYEIKFNMTGLTDTTSAVQNFVPIFDRGAISLNELRELVGLTRKDDDPAFDQHYITANLVPLELSGLSQQQPAIEEQVRNIVDQFSRRRLSVLQRS